ncbi:MAG: hypothetical protein CM1200mP40_12640 [Gammaproteobacteria bacterium]|nr:MAG: hypothetical protein CM1200mP40_12640 [Gammaproteobacteria bacterium]
MFTRDGQYVRTIGEPGNGVDSNSEFHYSRVAEIAIDPGASEAYLADGYGNKRVAVVDVGTGALKRFWGAYGNTPDDDADDSYTPGEPLPQQFRGPVHCAEPSNDGLIYVCDRGADRIQVFPPDGTFVKEGQVMPETLGSGSTWDISFSPDEDQGNFSTLLMVLTCKYIFLIGNLWSTFTALVMAEECPGCFSVLTALLRIQMAILHHRNLRRQTYTKICISRHGFIVADSGWRPLAFQFAFLKKPA